MNETQTRLDYIDPALKAAGWGTVEGSRIRVEFPITKGRIIGKNRRKKSLFADYVLEYKNRRLAVIEAKALNKYYTEGVGQAKDYANRLNIRYAYATNGEKIYGIDIEEGTEGDVTRYPTPDELWAMSYPKPIEPYKVEIEDWKKRFDAVPFEDRGGTWQPRYYQRNAIYKTLYAIAEKKDRLLLTMATGTGKTATAFQICWKLFNAKWNLQRDGKRSPRILFLADRNILADQAFNSFGAFEEEALVRIRPSEIRKKGRVPKNGSIFFTIFQSFMTASQNNEQETEDNEKKELNPEDFNFGQYAPDFFDFIIIDECHRGGANDESSWRRIMEYFSPAVQLGLTATPKRDVNVDTYKYFGEPIYTYALKDGIEDGFLAPFRVKQIQTNYDEYTLTADDVIEEGEAEVGDSFTYKDYGRKIIIKQVEEFRVQYLLDIMNQNQKTLVFCATQVHAAYIRDLINQKANSKNPNYCCRVTANDGKAGEKYLNFFQDNEKTIPTVLTTSQKLSTGVDAPEIRNIVLLRPVDSMVEFKQIVGRGTRLFNDAEKAYFTIFDFVKAHQHFKDSEWDGEPEPPEPPTVYTPRPETGGIEDPPIDYTCQVCNNDPCVCEKAPRRMVTVQLSKNKTREIDATVKTTFWGTNGEQITQEEFMQQLYGDLPSLFKDEEELRKLWSLPDTRRRLLQELSEKGYTEDQLNELTKLIHGENSDLYDVLSFIAYHKNLVPRLTRAEKAKVFLMNYNAQQQAFLNFVLEQYVRDGVSELDDKEKLGKLLELKYHALADAKRELGSIKEIRNVFIGFQQYLYSDKVG